MTTVRPPAVAGLFYPDDPARLRGDVQEMLTAARSGIDNPSETTPPAALIVPHAGYIYSGSTAASGYLRLDPTLVRRVVLLGPAHRVPVPGLALSSATFFATPLGEVAIEPAAQLLHPGLPQLFVDDRAHADEHSLEVHLPFLQVVLGEFTLVPIVAGRAQPSAVAAVIDHLTTQPDTAVLISSDLSHYLPYRQAQQTDAATIAQILAMGPPLTHEQACGATPINGLLHAAARRHWQPHLLASCNSGDTAGDKRLVVGYATVGFSTQNGGDRAAR